MILIGIGQPLPAACDAWVRRHELVLIKIRTVMSAARSQSFCLSGGLEGYRRPTEEGPHAQRRGSFTERESAW